MKYTTIGFCLGLLFAVLVFFAERTTQEIDWLLIMSFPLSWGIAGYLAWRWDILGTNGVGRE
jgi:hypothetical protein